MQKPFPKYPLRFHTEPLKAGVPMMIQGTMDAQILEQVYIESKDL
jgi:hypothetical protein